MIVHCQVKADNLLQSLFLAALPAAAPLLQVQCGHTDATQQATSHQVMACYLLCSSCCMQLAQHYHCSHNLFACAAPVLSVTPLHANRRRCGWMAALHRILPAST